MKIKRLLILCGVIAILLAGSYHHVTAYTCGSVCEDRMEQAVTSCLANGGDSDFCFTASKAIYCQCQYNECGVRDANGCGVILP